MLERAEKGVLVLREHEEVALDREGDSLRRDVELRALRLSVRRNAGDLVGELAQLSFVTYLDRSRDGGQSDSALRPDHERVAEEGLHVLVVRKLDVLGDVAKDILDALAVVLGPEHLAVEAIELSTVEIGVQDDDDAGVLRKVSERIVELSWHFGPTAAAANDQEPDEDEGGGRSSFHEI